MISHDQFAKALERQRIVMSNLQINALLNDLFPNPQCGFSVSGVSVWGDHRSIATVKHWHHDSTSVAPALRQRIGVPITDEPGRFFNVLVRVRDEGDVAGEFAREQVWAAIDHFIDEGKARVSFASTELIP